MSCHSSVWFFVCGGGGWGREWDFSVPAQDGFIPWGLQGLCVCQRNINKLQEGNRTSFSLCGGAGACPRDQRGAVSWRLVGPGMGTATAKWGQDPADNRSVSSAGCICVPGVAGGLRAEGGGEEEYSRSQGQIGTCHLI